MAHGDAREGNWRGNWRMEWVASTLHTTSEHGLSSITTADAHTSAASSQLKWRPRRFKRTRPFRRKTKSGSCTCAITFQLASTTHSYVSIWTWKCFTNNCLSPRHGSYVIFAKQHQHSGLEFWLLAAPFTALLQVVQVVRGPPFPKLLIETLNSLPSG